MLKQRLERLRRLSVGENVDAAKAMTYFLEKLAEYGLFVAHQKIFNNTHPFYQLIIPVAQYYGVQVDVTSITLFWVKTQRFVYGAVEFSNQLFALVYFFEDVQTGMAAVFFNAGVKQFFRWLENRLCLVLSNPHVYE